jgi:CO/xanthine dehydrogenase FAD-binding subunit
MTRAATPTSLAEALELMRRDSELVPVAGCTDLMVAEPEARADLPAVLDLLALPELRGISAQEDGLRVGATATFSEIRHSPLVGERYPALAAAAAEIGGWQIQNRATLGGNVVNASPAGDSLPVLLALDAAALVAGPDGQRRIPYAAFHTGYRQTALAAGELLVALHLPAPPTGSRQAFRKVGTRAAQAISKVVVCLLAAIEDGRFTAYRLSAGSVAATPLRLTTVEQEIVGRPANEETAALAGRLAAAAVEPIDDVRSTAAYRRFALERVVRRLTLELAT